MADQRIQYTEEMVGAGHPTKSDTLNRRADVEHNTDGTHKMTNGAAGDVFYHDGTKLVRLPKGTARQVLAQNSALTAPEWVASLQSLMTAIGDILYASAPNTPTRLAAGASGQVLVANGAAAPEWSYNIQEVFELCSVD